VDKHMQGKVNLINYQSLITTTELFNSLAV